MATTATESFAQVLDGEAVGASHRLPPRAVVLGCVGLALASASDSALAQAWHTEASIGAQATVTNNANYGVGGDSESDVVLNLFPAIKFTRDGGRLRINGGAALNMIGYVQGSQTSRIFPQVNILAELEAIERIFFIEGAVTANQELLNPFLPRSDDSSTVNKYTYGQVLIAPYFKGNFGPTLSYLLRSDNSYTFTTQSDAPLANAYFGNHVGEIVRVAEPIGWSLRVQSEVTRYKDQVQPDQTLDTALARVTAAPSAQLLIGARGGYEKTNYTISETSGAIYGADIEWSPTPVTKLAGYWENRFFGPSYQFDASHRGPTLASGFSFSRQLTTFPQLLLQVPPTGNVAGMLDAILISRFPDPIERSRQVQEVIARQGLPDSIPGAVNIYSENPNVVTSGDLTFALMGVRNTLALGLFYGKTEELPDTLLPPTFVDFNNSVQRGATITFSHRLSLQTTLSALTRWQETRGIDAASGDYTNQGAAQVQLTQQLTPRSNAFFGLRYQVTASNVGVDESEAALLAGLTHRF